jgi:aminopeptidase N
MPGRPILAAAIFLLLGASLPPGQAQSPPDSPFAPPRATLHYAPDRDYDLVHIALDLNVDYAKRAFQGVVVNTLAPLRDGLTTIRFDCGANLKVTSCELGGQTATFTRDGDTLKITAPQTLMPGKAVAVIVRYVSDKDSDGYHWVQPTPEEPQQMGFYTQGEPDNPRAWLPTWAYPNDFATSEMRVTVPADWYVVSNGTLKSSSRSADGKTRTFHWRLNEPHATYLNALCAGPFDIKTASWRGVPLLYVVPKGKGNRIEDTFGGTPDMLSFFSDTLGVKYPWPKYAQDAMVDFGGGMEYVSATTFGDGILTSARDGYRVNDGVIAHELSHQWFGDLVTCRDWGQLWLNEGFATFCANLYQEHARGKAAYDHGIEGAMQGYIGESHSYKRPIATHLYEKPGAMFDAHTYPKGAAVLHTLRRYLGDSAFYAGLRHYLTKFAHSPVDSRDLCAAMTEATGINLEPFFEQWVFKPGHPVLDYTWTWDEANKQVVLTVRQTQDTKDGTPLYDLNATVGLITGSSLTRQKARIDRADQQLHLTAASRPDAVLLDPDHDFLREIPALHWAASELPSLLRYAPNAVDREEAMKRMLEGTPSDAAIQAVAEVLRADRGRFPVFQSLTPLGDLKREAMRPLLREEMAHPDFDRRAQAILALGKLPPDPADVRTLRGLVTDQQPYDVVRAAVATLGSWDAGGNRDVFAKAAQMGQENDHLRMTAADALAKADIAQGKPPPDPDPKTTQMLKQFLSDFANGVQSSPRMSPSFNARINPKGEPEVQGWVREMIAFQFLARDDVAARGMEHNGGKVSSIRYYKLATPKEQWVCKLFLTPDGKVTGFQAFPL